VSPRDPRRAAAWAAGCLVASALAGVALTVVWWRHESTQIAGVLLATCLGTLAAGLATWANRLTPAGPFEEPRHRLADPVEREAAAEDVAEVAVLPRRRLVVTALVGAVGALGAALIVPFSSLGPRPGKRLLHTAWERGSRAVDGGGRRVMASDVPFGGIATVFPQGDAGAADSQVLLVRVDPDLLDLPAGREDWAINGLVGYSKVCTHAGCPVGLYSAETHELLCPCHQSSFDVLRGAPPTHGPAAWPLPQLPLRIDDHGVVVADGPLSAPVGPGWWRTDGS
jgi:ubiquinol-cytochrome c reductase iron-sulfur subunit